MSSPTAWMVSKERGGGRPGEPTACKYRRPLITRARCNLIHVEQQRLEDLG